MSSRPTRTPVRTGGVVTAPSAATRDPHRVSCNYEEGHTGWVSLRDYAVDHAPGWQHWQAFRESLVNKSVPTKLRLLREWPLTSKWNVIRVLNYTRSLRGAWNTFPQVKAFNEYVNQVYSDRY